MRENSNIFLSQKSIFLGRKFKLAFIKIVIFLTKIRLFVLVCDLLWYEIWSMLCMVKTQEHFRTKKDLKVFLGCLVEQCPQKQQAFSLDEKAFKWDF